MSEKDLKLYQYEVCPYCCKVKAVLDFKGIPYEKVEVNPMNKEEIAFAKPHKKVPVLVDGDQTIVESNDIIKYLDEKYPNKPVFQKERQDAQDKWIRFGDEELVQILPANIYRTFPEALGSFQYITKVGKFPAWKRYMIMTAGALIMNMVAKKGIKKRGITDPRASLKKTLEKWAEGLQGQKFMGGDQPNVADLVNYGILNSVHELKIWNFISQEKPVADWYQRVEATLQ